MRDHPRACGEKIFKPRTQPFGKGSPPRVRGKEEENLEDAIAVGITPARAGKSAGTARRGVAARDHPRACGEKENSPSSAQPEGGPPPRVRGKVDLVVYLGNLHGITPARAGKSCSATALCLLHRDHPRACGEKTEPGSTVIST